MTFPRNEAMIQNLIFSTKCSPKSSTSSQIHLIRGFCAVFAGVSSQLADVMTQNDHGYTWLCMVVHGSTWLYRAIPMIYPWYPWISTFLHPDVAHRYSPCGTEGSSMATGHETSSATSGGELKKKWKACMSSMWILDEDTTTGFIFSYVCCIHMISHDIYIYNTQKEWYT